MGSYSICVGTLYQFSFDIYRSWKGPSYFADSDRGYGTKINAGNQRPSFRRVIAKRPTAM